jgi:hypothetical protein
LAAGGRLFCNVCFQHDFGESRPGVLPDEKESVDILVATCKEILATSERVARLPHDPREVLEAAREDDDVLVTFRDVPASAAVRDLEDVLVADVAADPDGRLRFRAPDGPRDPFFHRLVATWKGEGWTLRRAWRIVDLVGTAERFVFAPKLVEAGATFAPRVLFLNSLTGAPVPGREARLALLVGGEAVSEAVGRSGLTGSVDATLEVPAELEPGPAELQVGEDRFPVQVQRTLRVAVVTDRTLYRATDEVCIRVMVHDATRGRPVAGREVVLRLGDEERTVETSAHGIASARMHLVEARLGDTDVTAEVGGVKAQARFTVRAFERPTFLVTTEPEQLVLRAGEAAPVIVRVRAVNGSPLAGAKVSVTTGRGRGSNGLTDAQGGFEYTARAAPDARVHRITVRDVDGRTAEHELHIALEGARAELELRPLEEPVVGRPCRFEVVGSAPGSVTLTSGDEAARTVSIGAEGRTIVEITPAAKRETWTLQSGEAEEIEHRLHACVVPLGVPLVLPDRRVAAVGETLTLALEGADGPVYVDVLRDGTVLRSLAALVAQGHATLDLPLASDLAGVLELRAWNLDETRKPRGSQVGILVVRGRSLSVEAVVAGESYRPTETAVVDVDVRDRQGRPTAAVLGYWGVDEALLALSPWHPVTEEVFDVLPADGKWSTGELARGAEHGGVSAFHRQRAALGPLTTHADLSRAFSLRHRSTPNQEQALVEARRQIVDAHTEALAARYVEAFCAVPLEALRTAHSMREVLAGLVTDGYLASDELRDPWGSPLDLHEALGTWRHVTRDEPNRSSWTWYHGYPCLGAGPDLVPGTGDDVAFVWTVPQTWELPGRLGRFLEMFAEWAEREGPTQGLTAPFWGPMHNSVIGLGGSAGGAFGGRGGSRDLGSGGGGRRVQAPVHVRRDFSPTLCFVPEAVVGPDGHARLEIPLKDSITTWRLRLVASAADGATGVGEARVRVSQPLHANPWIAPHLTVGDELEVPVAVRNETDEEMQVALALGVSPELEVLGVAAASLHVPAHEGAAHVFRYRAVARGSARVRVDATSDTARDAIERVVSVRPLEREVVEVKSGSVSSELPWTAAFPPLAADVDREHRVSVYPSPLAETLDGFEGLIACPHG